MLKFGWRSINSGTLSLNITKTDHEFMVIGSRQRMNVNDDENVNITIHGQPVKKVNETEILGMTIDQHRTCSRHVEERSKKISHAIGALKRIRPFITTDTANKIDKALTQLWNIILIIVPQFGTVLVLPCSIKYRNYKIELQE